LRSPVHERPDTVEAAAALAEELAGAGLAGVTIAWADNNGIPRSRTVPVGRLADVAVQGVGITTLFAVFDSHDVITFEHPGLSTPSGDIRLVPEVDRITRLAGQPAFAWAPGRQVAPDGSPWPYDQRSALEAQVARAAALGLERLAALDAPLTCIANVRTGALWGTHRSPAELLAYLETGDAAAGPHAEWDVGHFVGLLGLIGHPPARRGALVVVADSYRSLGHDGVHLQPAERAAEALAGRGVLLAVEPAHRAAAEAAVTGAGLARELWDNGSPDARASTSSA